VKESGDSFRDTMVATLDASGGWIPPLYIKTQSKTASYASGRRAAVNETPVKGMNNQKMMEYANHLDHYVDEPTLLVYDRLGSHTSKAVRSYIEGKICSDGRQKFKTLLLPPKGAFLISPLDFGFFAYWKSMYYQYDRSTPAMKFWAANQTWRRVETAKVVEFFRNCHMIGTEREETLRTKLHDLVRSGMPEELEEVWEFYDGWMAGSYEVEAVSAPREAPFDKPLQLDDASLDGLYWNNWGSHGHRE
jgi:hypothetical protein